MSKVTQMVLGLVLSVIGAIGLLQNLRISNISMTYKHHGVNIGGLLVLLIIVIIIAAIATGNAIFKWILLALVAIALMLVILNMKVSLIKMSGLEMVIIFGSLAIGIGLLLKSLFSKE